MFDRLIAIVSNLTLPTVSAHKTKESQGNSPLRHFCLMMLSSLFDANSLATRSIAFGVIHVLVTIGLEATCLDQVRQLRSTVTGRSLHTSSLIQSFLLDLTLEPLMYYVGIAYFSSHEGSHHITIGGQILGGAGIIVIQGFLFYLLHRAFHEVKGLYWIHRYHHKFNTIVLPSTGVAVSAAEYLLAYILPILIAYRVMQPYATEAALLSSAFLMAIFNLLDHTPWMQSISLPWIFVSAKDHMQHHRKNRDDYGAPIFHTDRILDVLFSMFS